MTTPIPEPPTRTFVVTLLHPLGESHMTLQGHTLCYLDGGGLDILRNFGGSLWTIAVFAPGQWSRVEVSSPTPEDVAASQRINDEEEQETQRRMMMAQRNVKIAPSNLN